MFNDLKKYYFLFFFIFFILSNYLCAEFSKTISFQGKLLDDFGKVVNTTKNITVKLYNVENGGTALWTEIHNNVIINDGILNLELGSITDLDLKFDTQYWLGITIESEAEMSPRKRLNPSPYACYSILADTANNILFSGIIGDTITKSEVNNLISNYESDSQNTEIRLTDLEIFKISVNDTISADSISLIEVKNIADSYIKNYESDTINGSFYVTDNIWIGTNALIVDSTGNVGIGSNTPEYKLDVFNGPARIIASNSGEILRLQGSSGSQYYMNINAFSPAANNVSYYFSIQDNAGIYDTVLVFNQGKIGIGTSSPSDSLTIAGSVYGDSLTIRDTIYASAFVGDGSGLTGVNAGKFSGVLGDSIYISSSTKLGLGTNDPQADLEIVSSGSPSLKIYDSNWNSGDSISLLFYNSNAQIYKHYDSGLIIDDNNAIIFQENHNEILRIDTGKIGIGISNPTEKLEIGEGNIQFTNQEQYIRFGSIGGYQIGRTSDELLAFVTNGETRMIIQQNGNVGIGTNFSSDSLTISGSLSAESMTISQIVYANAFIGDGSNLTGISGGEKFSGTVGDSIYVNSTKIGIGTLNPVDTLTIQGGITLAEITEPVATANYGKLYVKSSDSKLYFKDDSGNEVNLYDNNAGTVPEYAYITLTGATLTSGSVIDMNSMVTGNMIFDGTNNRLTLKAGKTYLLQANLWINCTGTGYSGFGWWDVTNNVGLGSVGFVITSDRTSGESSQPVASAIVTPVTDIEVDLRQRSWLVGVTAYSGSCGYIIVHELTRVGDGSGTGGTADNLGNHIATSNLQLGSYWLSNDGNSRGLVISSEGQITISDTLNIGDTFIVSKYENVGIGETLPATKLDVAGTVTASAFVGDGSGLTGVNKFLGIVNDSVYIENTNIGIGTTNPNDSLTVQGGLSLAKISEPSNTANYGKLYVKSDDSKLYYKDDSGNEYDLTENSVISGTVPYYILLTMSASQNSLVENSDIAFDSKVKGNLSHNAGTSRVTLNAGSTYYLSAGIAANLSGYATYSWYDHTNSIFIGLRGIIQATNRASEESSQSSAIAVFTPTSTVEVGLRVMGTDAAFTVRGGVGYELSYASIVELTRADEGGSGSADNLGNHTATQNITLGSNYISNDGENEGISISSEGQVTVSHDGSQSIKIIGTADNTNPSELYFDKSVSGAENISSIGFAKDRGFFVWVNGLDRLNIDTSGNLGIGTSSPEEQISVVDDDGTAAIRIEELSGIHGNWEFRVSQDLDGLAIWGGDEGNESTRLFIKGTTGYVGLGTVAPTEKLEINGNLKVSGSIMADTVFQVYGSASGIRILADESGYDYIQSGENDSDMSARLRITRWKTPSDTLLEFQVFADTNYISGNLGIGTMSPESVLDLGSGSSGRNISFSKYVNFGSEYSSADLILGRMIKPVFENSGLQYSYTGIYAPTALKLTYTGDLKFAAQINNSYTEGNTFDFDNNVKFLVQNNGNVGIGITVPSDSLHISGGLIVGNTSNTNAGTIRWTGTNFEGYDGSSWQALDALPTASAGGWTDDGSTIRLTTGSDNVGIGTTAPSEKLHVYGGNFLIDRGTTTSSLTRSITVGGARYLNDNDFASIIFQNYDSNSGAIEYIGSKISSQNEDGDGKGDLRFSTYDGTNLNINMLITSNGLVGIGTSTPDKLLTLSALDNSYAIKILDTTYNKYITIGHGNDYSVFNSDSLTLGYRLQFDGITEFSILNDGKTGIGTAVPSEKLHIYGGNLLIDRGTSTSGLTRTITVGGARYSSGSDFASIIFQNYDSNSGATEYIGAQISSQNEDGNGKGDLRFLTFDGSSLNTNMIINSAGNVSIGTTTATDSLTVEGAIRGGHGQGNGFKLRKTDGTSVDILDIDSGNELRLKSPGPNMYINPDVVSHTYINPNQGGAGNILMVTGTSTGNVGIGTSNPVQKLHINSLDSGILLTNGSGNDQTRSVTSIIQTNEIRGLSAPGLDAGQLRLSAGGGTNSDNISYIDLYGYSTRDMRFGTGGTEKLRITEQGNIGIGTTTPDNILDISGDSGIEPQVHIYNPINSTGSIAGLRLSTSSGWNVQLRTCQDSSWLELTNSGGIPTQRWDEFKYYPGNADAYITGKDTGIYIIGDSIGINTTSPSSHLHIKGSILGGTGDMSDMIRSTLTLEDLSSYPRILMKSVDANVAGVYNYQTGKSVFWGESSDTGQYYFRGRDIISEGRVGIGTSAPEQLLHIHSASSANITLSSPANLCKGIYWKNSDENKIWEWSQRDNGNGGDFWLNYFNSSIWSTLLAATTSGNVGIGTTSPSSKLHVNGMITITSGATETVGNCYYAIYGGGNNTWQEHVSGGSGVYSIRAEDRIQAWQFETTSDVRMKNILNQSDSNQDLKIIEKIKVTDYKYIDKIIKGSKIHKKLIAQELEKVFPQAVSKSTDFVPSIYAKSYSTFFDEPKKKLRIILDKFHKLGIGDTIRIYVLENNLQKEIRKTVTEINDDYTFTINSEKNYKNIFVWGKQVNDFRTIDYEAVSMLHLSATQELIKRLNYTENENQILKRRLEKLENLIKKILEK